MLLEVGVELGGADTAEAREHRSESNLAPRGLEPTRDAPGFIFNFKDGKLTRSVENSRCPWRRRREGQRFNLQMLSCPWMMLILRYAIWFAMDQHAQPLPGAPTVDKICSAVHRGVSCDGRFVGEDTRNQEPDGDTRRRDSDLDRFRPSNRRNTLHPVSLVYCIEYEIYVAVCSHRLGDPYLSLYTLEG